MSLRKKHHQNTIRLVSRTYPTDSNKQFNRNNEIIKIFLHHSLFYSSHPLICTFTMTIVADWGPDILSDFGRVQRYEPLLVCVVIVNLSAMDDTRCLHNQDDDNNRTKTACIFIVSVEKLKKLYFIIQTNLITYLLCVVFISKYTDESGLLTRILL